MWNGFSFKSEPQSSLAKIAVVLKAGTQRALSVRKEAKIGDVEYD
jgi:hypothetical protein